jgi:hypothetical protein
VDRRLCESDGRKRSFAADSARTTKRFSSDGYQQTIARPAGMLYLLMVAYMSIMGYVSDRFMMEHNPATTIGVGDRKRT